MPKGKACGLRGREKGFVGREAAARASDPAWEVRHGGTVRAFHRTLPRVEARLVPLRAPPTRRVGSPSLPGGAQASGTSHALPCSTPEARKAGQEFEMIKLAFMF